MEVSEITKEIYQDSKNKYLVIQNDIQGQDSIAVNMLKNNDMFITNLRYFFEHGAFRFKDLKCKEALLKCISY